MIGTRLGRYEITEKLGEGGMGVVYKAHDTHLDRSVALKVLPAEKVADAERKRRFVQEAKAASALSHPSIVTVYDIDRCADVDFIAMEYVAGRTLDRLIGSTGLPLAEALEYAVQITDALATAHAAGIVHRDLKPANIMVTEKGLAKLLDFGLAKLSESAVCDESTPTETRLTGEGMILGTVAYLSPEQARGQRADARSDLFSLGAVLYECLTGRRAFPGRTTLEALAQVLETDPPPPSQANPGLPERVDEIVMRALAKRPEDRYPSAAEMLADLRSLRGAAGPLRARARSAALRWAGAGGLAAAVLAAAWSLWLLRPGPSRPPPAEALRWYQEGVGALRDGTYYKAAQALQRAVEQDPGFALSNARLAEAWNELDYSDRARDAMLRATAPGVPISRLAEADRLQLQAVYAVLTNDVEGAVARYRELEGKVEEPERASVLLDLGRALERADRTADAATAYSEASRRRPDLAAAPLRLGVLARRQRRYAEAAGLLQQAEALYRSLSNLEGVTQALYDRGIMANQAGKLDEARALLDQALALAQAGGNEYQRIVVLMQLSSVGYAQGRAAEAERDAARALELARASGFEDLTARALMEVGGNAHVRGELAQAKTWYLQALEGARRFKGRRSEMRALVSLASVRLALGESDEAVRDLEAPLAWYERNGFRKDASTARILQARAMQQAGDYAGAAAALDQQVSEARRAGDEDQLILGLGELASVRVRQGRYADALAGFRESYAVSVARGNKLRMRWEAAHLGDALWRVGRYSEARGRLAEAQELAAAGGDKALLAWLGTVRGAMALSEGRFAEAATFARSVESGGGDPEDAQEAARIGALAALGSGRRAEARRLLQRAAALAKATETAHARCGRLLVAAAVGLDGGDAAGALRPARQAREVAARSGMVEAEWLALGLAAQSAAALGDTRAAQAREALGAEQEGFLRRPDLQRELQRVAGSGVARSRAASSTRR